MVSSRSSDVTVTFCVICHDADCHLLYNRLDDINNQTVAPDEILIVASGCEPHINGVHVYSQPTRKYAGWARNKGASLAESEVIAFCDVDDIIHPGKCHLLKRIFINNHVSAMVHSYYIPQNFNRWCELDFTIEEAVKISGINISMPGTPPVAHGGISCRKSVFNKVRYDEDLARGQDGVFCKTLVHHDELKIFYNPTKLMIYIQSSGCNSDPAYFGI